MIINNLYLDTEKSGFTGFLLVDSKPWQEYQDGKKTGKVLGTTYTVAMSGHQLDKINVHIANDSANLESKMQPVNFQNLQIKLYPDYRNAGQVGITATADAITPVKEKHEGNK